MARAGTGGLSDEDEQNVNVAGDSRRQAAARNPHPQIRQPQTAARSDQRMILMISILDHDGVPVC